MSDTLRSVQALVARGEVQVSLHGLRELAADAILLGDAMAGCRAATLVEDYPGFSKGPSVLVLQQDDSGRPIHVVWGIPKGRTSPAVLVTAYRPDPGRWSADFMIRRKR
jgi:hypothetical protein